MKNRTSSRKFKKKTIDIAMHAIEVMKAKNPDRFQKINVDKTRIFLESKVTHKFKSLGESEQFLSMSAEATLNKLAIQNFYFDEEDCANALFGTLFNERVFRYLDFWKRWDVIPTWAGLIYIIIKVTGGC